MATRSAPLSPIRAAALCALLFASAAFADEQSAMWRADAGRYETGDGVARDPEFAATLYCRLAAAGDAESQFHLGWMYAYGRGVERNDAWAAYFFRLAAAQGIEQAPAMLKMVGASAEATPDCMRPPAPLVDAAAEAAAHAAAAQALAATRTNALLKLAPKPIAALVLKLAPEYRIQPGLALAIMKAESNFDSTALSPKNAMGLMQLIPETAERFAVKDAYDPKQNIKGGLAYLRWLLAYFEGDVALVAAAYNSGEGTVDRYQGVPPFSETRGYVQRVVDAVGIAIHPFDPKVVAPSPRLVAVRKIGATSGN